MRDTVPIFLRPRHWPWTRRLAATGRWLWGLLREIRRRRREGRAGLLTVGVDIASLEEPLTGIGWYLVQLLRQLADAPGLRLRLYGNALVADPNAPRPVVELPRGTAIERVLHPLPPGDALFPGRLARGVQRLAPLLVAADGNAVLFAPNYLAPPSFRLACGALVATVHDLAVERLPWAVRPDSRTALEARLARTWREATRLITPSAAVRSEVIAAGHFDPRRVTAIHHGPGQAATAGAGSLPPEVVPPFALAVGTIEPRKNLGVLLAAWPLLPAPAPQLVLCGQLGWASEALRRQIAAASREGWLLHLGYVDAGALVALYREAALVAFPSLYEGFGLPAVEAMGCGAPLVASDLPVLREVAGDAALYVAPEDPAAWAAAVGRVLTEPGLAGGLRRKGRERVQRFRWEQAAAETVAVWKQAAG